MSEPIKDPICGKEVDPLRARAVGIFGGVTYYFCSQDCKTKFKDPRKAPRDPTLDLAARPAQKPAAAEPVEPAAKPAAVARDRPRMKPPVDDDEAPAKVDPSPSVQEEIDGFQKTSRAWLIVALLTAGAVAALYFAFRK